MNSGSTREREINFNELIKRSLPFHVADRIATGQVDFDIDHKYELIELQAKEQQGREALLVANAHLGCHA